MVDLADVRSCLVCCNIHPLRLCQLFMSFSPKQKLYTVRAHGYCSNCLIRTHTFIDCTSRNTCATCGKFHHTLLHESFVPTPSSYRRVSFAPLPDRSHKQTDRAFSFISHGSNEMSPQHQTRQLQQQPQCSQWQMQQRPQWQVPHGHEQQQQNRIEYTPSQDDGEQVQLTQFRQGQISFPQQRQRRSRQRHNRRLRKLNQGINFEGTQQWFKQMKKPISPLKNSLNTRRSI